MPLLVVRHAPAGRRSAYKGDDRRRPLSPRGRAWAAALVPLLTGFEPQAVMSSPFVRCVQTVAPTAEALGLAVEPEDALAEGNTAEGVSLLKRLAGRSVVLCTHGDVALAMLVSLWSDTSGPPPPNLKLQKGDVWVIESAGSSQQIVDHIRRTKPPSPAQ
jgi:8-oxo-(d)GTP phosphatase